MSTIDYTREHKEILAGKDQIVIRKYIAGLEGGRSLDVTDYTKETIEAGTVVITNGTLYKPIIPTVTNNDITYSLPDGFSFVGIVAATITASIPAASVMIAGVVNEAALPYPVSIEVKKALPHIIWVKDEIA